MHVMRFPAGVDIEGWTPDRVVVRQASAAFARTGVITPSTLAAGPNNDYNPTGLSTASILRLTPNSLTSNLTGLSGGASGRIITLLNLSDSDYIRIDHESTGSSAANRFDIGGNHVIYPHGSITLMYDATASRWKRDVYDLRGLFMPRMRRTSTTNIALDESSVFGVGNLIEINGELISWSDSINTTDNRIDSAGADVGAAMGASVVYFIYASNSKATFGALTLRASTVQPTSTASGGILYLGQTGNAANWRYVGMVRTNGSTQFVDLENQRFVINYYNQQALSLWTCPGYNNNNAATTYTHTNTAAWGAANAGTGSKIEFLVHPGAGSGGAQPVQLFAIGSVGTVVGIVYIGIGIDSTTSPTVAAFTATTNTNIACAAPSSINWSSGYHAVDLLFIVGTSAVVYADTARFGAAADPACTVMFGWILG